MSFLDALMGLFGGGSEPVPEIRVDELATTLKSDKKARLIDVRTPGEFRAVRATRAENVPLDRIGGALDGLKLPTDAPVYVICHSGNRSRRAAQVMRKAGYDAVNVVGGTSSWLARDLPCKRG